MPTKDARPAVQPSGSIHVEKVMNTEPKNGFKLYQIATIVLAVVCGVLLCTIVFILLRRKKTHAAKEPETDENKDVEYMVPKQVNERNYQTIRRFPSFGGVPKRNTHSYETIKLPFRQGTHPTVSEVFSSRETGQHYDAFLPGETGQEYETCSPSETGQEYENVRSRIRDSNPYMPMDQALAGSILAASAAVLPTTDNENDIYLTMKKSLGRTTESLENETQSVLNETQSVLL